MIIKGKISKKKKIITIIVILMMIGIATYAVRQMLMSKVKGQTRLTKEKYVTARLIGMEEEKGSIKPGGVVRLKPAIRNEGDVVGSAYIEIRQPKMRNKEVYRFKVGRDWEKVGEEEGEEEEKREVYSYGIGQLKAVEVGKATEPLTTKFEMRDDITGKEFKDMEDIDIKIEAYLVEQDIGRDPKEVWDLIKSENNNN